MLGESLVESLDEAYQHIADATQDFSITAKVGPFTKQCRRNQLSSPPYRSSGVIQKREVLISVYRFNTPFAAAPLTNA